MLSEYQNALNYEETHFYVKKKFENEMQFLFCHFEYIDYKLRQHEPVVNRPQIRLIQTYYQIKKENL